MSERKKRFFSGASLQAALVSAASEYGIPVEEVNYKVVEKKHGFLRVRRNVVLQVDPENPRKEPEEVPPEHLAPDAPSAGAAPPEKTTASGGGEPSRVGAEEGAAADTAVAAVAEEAREVPEAKEPPPVSPATEETTEEAASARRTRRRRRRTEPREEVEEVPPSLVPVEERLPEAEGPLSEAALEASEWLLDLVDLDMDPRVFEGEERFEIELRGDDRDLLLVDDGKALSAIEHLVPRVMRGVGGESYACRVDSENFQAEREQRLRANAIQLAAEVKQKGKPEVLDPMDPGDRRVVHLALNTDDEVSTHSLGDGYFKRVKISPA